MKLNFTKKLALSTTFLSPTKSAFVEHIAAQSGTLPSAIRF